MNYNKNKPGMRKKKSKYYYVSIFVFLLFLTSCSSDNSPTAPKPVSSKSEMAQQVHSLINNYRKSNGLSSLRYSDSIAAIALTHSQNMANGSVPFSHDGFSDRAQQIAKIASITSAAENVAWNRGYNDPAQTAVDGWIDSEGHLKNIIGDYNTTGVGVAVNDDGEYYFTQLFAKTN